MVYESLFYEGCHTLTKSERWLKYSLNDPHGEVWLANKYYWWKYAFNRQVADRILFAEEAYR